MSNSSSSELTSEVDSLYLESYSFTTAAALVGSLNKRVMIVLRDGKIVFGILRSFDQFANLVIQDVIERIYLKEKKQYGESSQDNFVIRGENVVMMGEIEFGAEDEELEQYELIDYGDAYVEKKKKNEEKIKKGKEESAMCLKYGYESAFLGEDLY